LLEELKALAVQDSQSSFLDHSYDVIEKIRTYLSRAHSTRLDVVRANSLWLCDIAFKWLLIQHGRFKIARRQLNDERWVALNKFVATYASELKLESIPLPLLGDSYFSTGSFQYYRKLAMRLEKEFYLISVDASDPPLFWPLMIHELSHCWLGSSDVIASIQETHSNEINLTNQEMAESRLEEALCDALATRLIGPAYPLSYINKLWAQFPREVSPWYPTNEFRLECMAIMLSELRLHNLANDIRDIANGKFAGKWDDEEIACSINDLINVAREMSKGLSPEVYAIATKSEKILESPTTLDMPTLFFSCWNALNLAQPNQISSTLDKTSVSIINALKGRT
jgi:hypothetical protein